MRSCCDGTLAFHMALRCTCMGMLPWGSRPHEVPPHAWNGSASIACGFPRADCAISATQKDGAQPPNHRADAVLATHIDVCLGMNEAIAMKKRRVATRDGWMLAWGQPLARPERTVVMRPTCACSHTQLRCAVHAWLTCTCACTRHTSADVSACMRGIWLLHETAARGAHRQAVQTCASPVDAHACRARALCTPQHGWGTGAWTGHRGSLPCARACCWFQATWHMRCPCDGVAGPPAYTLMPLTLLTAPPPPASPAGPLVTVTMLRCSSSHPPM